MKGRKHTNHKINYLYYP